MVIDDPFRVARRAGCVIKRDRLPFVFRQGPFHVRVAFREERFILDLTDQFPAGIFRVVHANHQRLGLALGQGIFGQGGKLLIDNHRFRFSVIEDERDSGGIQPVIDGVDDRTDHGHAVMSLQHGRDVGANHRHCIAQADAPRFEGRSQAARTRIEFAIGKFLLAMNDRDMVRKDVGVASQKR